MTTRGGTIDQPGGIVGKSKAAEDYSDEQALSIHDESVRLRREVRKIVGSSVAFVSVSAAFALLLGVMQNLQSASTPGLAGPEWVLPPASGSLVTAAFGALLAVILGVWFSPSTFRLGSSESPATIARELAARETATTIARVCVWLSLAVGLWAAAHWAFSGGPEQIDPVRVVGPVVLGVGLSWWAAAAEVRLAVTPNRKLRWARLVRETERLKNVMEDEESAQLSERARQVQWALAFAVVPVMVWAAGLFVYPSPDLRTGVARLVAAGAAAAISYYYLGLLSHSFVGKQLGTATSIWFLLLAIGVLYAALGVSAALYSTGTSEAVELGQAVRAVLALNVLTIAGPFSLIWVFTWRRVPSGKRGVIFDQTMRRYEREVKKSAEAAQKALSGEMAGSDSDQAKGSFAWASLLAFVPVLPFNLMFADLAIRQSRDGKMTGRGLAILSRWFGVLVTVLVLGWFIYVVVINPRLVYCDSWVGLCLEN